MRDTTIPSQAPAARDGPSVDGRRRRGEDNRAKIVAALLSLVRDGDFTPGAEQVAARAQVSLRTVFRHFEDMERLYAEIVAPIEAELRTLAAQPFEAEDWRGKLAEIVDRRSTAYEAYTPLFRAAEVHRYNSPRLVEANVRFAAVSLMIIRGLLPADLQDGWLPAALEVLLSFEAWLRLRNQNLEVDAAREVLKTAVGKLTA